VKLCRIPILENEKKEDRKAAKGKLERTKRDFPANQQGCKSKRKAMGYTFGGRDSGKRSERRACTVIEDRCEEKRGAKKFPRWKRGEKMNYSRLKQGGELLLFPEEVLLLRLERGGNSFKEIKKIRKKPKGECLLVGKTLEKAEKLYLWAYSEKERIKEVSGGATL